MWRDLPSYNLCVCVSLIIILALLTSLFEK